MMASNNNWQRTMKSLNDCGNYLFNNSDMSDVTFIFKTNETEEPTRIYAHSWILSMFSSLFYNSFKNNFEVQTEIPVSEGSYENFLECIKFLYTNQCQIQIENVHEIMTIARKYSLQHLESECFDFITKNVTIETVCLALEEIVSHENDDELKDKLIQYIAQRLPQILQTTSFIKIKKETLEMIMIMNEKDIIEEMELFQAIMRWAAYQCSINGMIINGENKRHQLGHLYEKIRFLKMTVEELSECIIKEDEFLTSEEAQSLFVNIVSQKKVNIVSKTNNYSECESETENQSSINLDQIPEKWINLYDINQQWKWSKHPELFHIISNFTVNKTIYLTGIEIARPNIFQNAIIKLLDDTQKILHERKFEVEENIASTGIYKPVILIANQKYSIDIQYENTGCQFICVDKCKSFPVSFTLEDVQFRFYELSQLLQEIHFKIIE